MPLDYFPVILIGQANCITPADALLFVRKLCLLEFVSRSRTCTPVAATGAFIVDVQVGGGRLFFEDDYGAVPCFLWGAARCIDWELLQGRLTRLDLDLLKTGCFFLASGLLKTFVISSCAGSYSDGITGISSAPK